MKRLIVVCLCAAVLATACVQEAFAWGAVSGPRGGAAYRGPAGNTAVRGPNGGVAVSGGGVYHGATGYRPYYPGAAVATGVAIGAAAATAYPPPAYYPPPCGYYPYPACY
jgi:hypothetical protein